MRSRGRCSGSGRRAGLRVLPDRSARSGGGAAISAAASSSATLLKLGKLQLELLDQPGAALGGLAEPLAAHPGEQQPSRSISSRTPMLGLGIPGPRLGLEPGCALGQDHGVRRDEIGGQRLAVG